MAQPEGQLFFICGYQAVGKLFNHVADLQRRFGRREQIGAGTKGAVGQLQSAQGSLVLQGALTLIR